MNFKAIFQACNAELSADRVVEMLNLRVQNGYIICPAHNDSHPSARLFDDGWCCYACGASGDLIDFIAKHEGVKAWDAVKTIDGYYSLNLLKGKSRNAVSTKQRKDTDRVFQEWVDNSIQLLSCFLRLMRKAYRIAEADETKYYIQSQGQYIGLILDRMQILSPEESYEELKGEIDFYVKRFEGCKTGQDIVYRLGRAEAISRYCKDRF